VKETDRWQIIKWVLHIETDIRGKVGAELQCANKQSEVKKIQDFASGFRYWAMSASSFSLAYHGSAIYSDVSLGLFAIKISLTGWKRLASPSCS
jgi:hypothetical protein